MDHNESCQDGVWVFLPFLPDGEWAHLTSEEARKQDGELKPENDLIRLACWKLQNAFCREEKKWYFSSLPLIFFPVIYIKNHD